MTEPQPGGPLHAAGDLWSEVKGAVSSNYRSNVFGTSQRSVDKAIEELQNGKDTSPSFFRRLFHRRKS